MCLLGKIRERVFFFVIEEIIFFRIRLWIIFIMVFFFFYDIGIFGLVVLFLGLVFLMLLVYGCGEGCSF